MGEEAPNKGGRPRGRFDSKIDWSLAESLYVNGETDAAGAVTFPSYSQIAERAGTSKPNVCQRAKRYNWAELRQKAMDERNARAGIETGSPGAMTAPVGPSNPRARVRRNAEQILDAYIALFDKQLRLGKVRADAMNDLDKAIRLRAFVRGEADSRKATHTTVSLTVLQQRHSATRAIIDTVGEEVTGVIHGGEEGYSLDGEAERDVIAEAGRPALLAPRSGWVVAAARVAASDE